MPYKDRERRLEYQRIHGQMRRLARKSANPKLVAEEDKDKNFRLKYSLSLVEWRTWYKASKGLCFICKRFRPEKYTKTDHKDNFVRGLLCHNCNTGLGKFQDDPSLLRRAADYIEGKVTEFIPILPEFKNKRGT